jgi:hypothetical protein
MFYLSLLIHVLVCHLHKIVGVELSIVVTHVFLFPSGHTESSRWVDLSHSEASELAVLFFPTYRPRTSCMCSFETYCELSKSKVITQRLLFVLMLYSV